MIKFLTHSADRCHATQVLAVTSCDTTIKTTSHSVFILFSSTSLDHFHLSFFPSLFTSQFFSLSLSVCD